MKRLFKYLNYSQRLRTRYKPKENNLIKYSDVDYAVNDKDRRSTIRYVYILNGGAVTWALRK
jgi:hypothetical protein